MLDFTKMSDNELYYPELSLAERSAAQSRFLAADEPAVDDEADTRPLSIPLPDLSDSDWPAVDYSEAFDDSEEPDADSRDGDLLLPFEE